MELSELLYNKSEYIETVSGLGAGRGAEEGHTWNWYLWVDCV